ncbi:hypothetical protein ACHAQA_000270 [Verticillium albo-atrum]
MTGSADPDDGIPDDVSLNSTLCSEADSEAQWNFERILAEAPNDDGVPWYLIQWTGYDKDEWSWEPRENIPVDGLEEWAETKAKQDRGEIEPFDIEKWLVEAASIKEAKASVKRERHRKRNFRRKREGLPMNLYDDEREQDYDVSDEDASNDDFNDILPPPKPPAGDASLPKKSPLKPQSLYADLKPKRKAPTDKPSNPSGSSSASKTATRREPAKQTTTGYQGTARKSSLTARPKPSHDVASTAARPIDTAAPPHSTDGPGTKRAKKSAGEKTTFRSATGNVFISGKKTQTRPKLADKIANPSKEARLFSNHSITRKVELKGREKADKAPSDIRQLGLFNISTGVATSASQTDSSSTAGPKKPPAQASPLKDARPPLEATKSSLKKSHSEAFPDPNEPLQEALRKKSRSVHFTGDTTTVEHSEPTSTPYPKDMPLVDEPEAMDTDDEELFVRGSSSQRLPRAPNAGANIAELRRMSLQDAFDRCKTQAVSKRVKLGSADSAEADVVFEDIPTTGESWVNQFIEEDPLVFDRIFTARGFSSQCQTQPGLSAGNLAQGSIRSDTQGASLEAAAESLRLGSFGVLYFHSDFCVIIYPSGCEDWMACVPENEPDNSAEVVLKYLVFRPNPSTAQPLTLTDGISHQTTLSNRVDMMRVMFGLEYKELLPTRLLKDQTGLSKEQGHHNFFLAFPPTADVMLNSIAAWLTEANPDCRLFSSQRGGDWHAFTSLGSQQCGTIIIHEDATPSVRLFAGLGHLLHQRNNVSFALWSLGVGTQVHPPFPSMDDQPSKPGHVTLTRLFPHGSAVLVTPSFLVAQPIQARRLLSWYSKRLAMPGAWNKLVVSASIVEFLQELSHEKAVQRQNFLSRNSRHFGPDLEVQAQQQGISHEDCIARLETLSMVTRLINSGKGNLADEVQEPFVYVDDCIDANDEQSLGNWFGFWSLTKLDCYQGILPAQRALIDFVEQGSAEKNPGMPLQRVWLGGFDVPALNSTTVLDQTLEVLRMMLNNPKHWMPAPETALPLRGYRKVEARQERTAPDDTERHGGVVDERPEKIIFHPPRGNGSHEGIGRSKCGNVLFQEVSKIRLTDNQRTDMPFRFPPTMEWYMRQKTEDRHYEYINVDTWEGMFVSLSIPTDDGKKAPRRDNHGIESGTTSAHTTPRS